MQQVATITPMRAGSVEDAIVDTLRRRFGPLYVWVERYMDRAQYGSREDQPWFGLAVQFEDEEWQHVCRRRTLQELWQFAQSVEL